MNSGLVVIGAQKCATATLNSDLSKCEGFEIDVDGKESSPLLNLGRFGSRKAIKHFTTKNSSNISVDISTRYSMAPVEIVNFSLLKTILPNLKVVYLVRQPLQRTLSHYQHDSVVGIRQTSFEKDVHLASPYVLNSLYGAQITPWLDCFGKDNVLLIDFSEYVINRMESVKKICAFAGIECGELMALDFMLAENVTETRKRLPGKIGEFQRTAAFQNVLRPIVPKIIRQRVKKGLELPNSSERATVSSSHIKYLNEIYRLDNENLVNLVDHAPQWEFEN